ncbi:hypothetical protein [Frankia nepalensis]|uniref:Uncharacterized protein n=2 Tax=Frankia nepalensis TaxID=1836974 RepID=A0A937US12_9ACTN|nr:hypothetical protein [Frankia nepalensis]MBL7498644.1 hypothetical protein [Frankia nepalensis]MBL7509190.1 hypothetical protein [Frankia nepalensis]MBL7628381.1 hypothetical protein [Frankia nepalensis]
MAACLVGQSRLAALSGVSVSTIRIVQRGDGRRNVTAETLTLLCRALGWPDGHLARVLLGREVDDTAAPIGGIDAAQGRPHDGCPTCLARSAAEFAAGDGGGAKEGRTSLATVSARPGTGVELLAAQLAQVPAGYVFVEAFGDESPVLVFGPASGQPSRRALLSAVVGSLAPGWDG